MSADLVSIHYRRVPDLVSVFRQEVIHRSAEYIVSYVAAAEIGAPVRAGDATILEPGAPIVWFTYPGEWYDIGRFHLVDGTFTGIYANVLTPVLDEGDRWETTDLCLDVWSGVDGRVLVLDEDEFEAAVGQGWIDAPTATRARSTADALAAAARAGDWPPPHVGDWTLERARTSAFGRAAP